MSPEAGAPDGSTNHLDIPRLRFGLTSLPYKISYRGDDYRDGDGDKCLAKDQAHRHTFPVRLGCVGSSFQLGRTVGAVKMVAAGNIAEPCRVRAVGYRLWGPIVCQFKARTNVMGGHSIRR